ncbi:superoxide dismutase [Syncephalis fuscata]|nr:superoxide dismutase [Syncephalis fuscata]
MVFSSHIFRTGILTSTLAGIIASGFLVSASSYEKASAVINGPKVNGIFTFDQTATGVTINGAIESGLCTPGNYSYHIHENYIPEGGNCQDAGKHFDPVLDNDSSTGEKKCELGDLSGKFGTISVQDTLNKPIPPFRHIDPSLTLVGKNNIVGRSIVIHNPDGSRLACANIRLTNHSTNVSTSNKTHDTSNAGTPQAPPNQPNQPNINKPSSGIPVVRPPNYGDTTTATTDGGQERIAKIAGGKCIKSNGFMHNDTLNNVAHGGYAEEIVPCDDTPAIQPPVDSSIATSSQASPPATQMSNGYYAHPNSQKSSCPSNKSIRRRSNRRSSEPVTTNIVKRFRVPNAYESHYIKNNS